jgi:hypothetical protein
MTNARLINKTSKKTSDKYYIKSLMLNLMYKYMFIIYCFNNNHQTTTIVQCQKKIRMKSYYFELKFPSTLTRQFA